jgi:hypothetical protein
MHGWMDLYFIENAAAHRDSLWFELARISFFSMGAMREIGKPA